MKYLRTHPLNEQSNDKGYLLWAYLSTQGKADEIGDADTFEEFYDFDNDDLNQEAIMRVAEMDWSELPEKYKDYWNKWIVPREFDRVSEYEDFHEYFDQSSGDVYNRHMDKEQDNFLDITDPE